MSSELNNGLVIYTLADAIERNASPTCDKAHLEEEYRRGYFDGMVTCHQYWEDDKRRGNKALHHYIWGTLRLWRFKWRDGYDPPPHYATEPERKRLRGKFADKRKGHFAKLVDEYGYRCMKCGDTGELHVDHITPLARGGSNNYDNLQLLCSACNIHKRLDVVDYRPNKGNA